MTENLNKEFLSENKLNLFYKSNKKILIIFLFIIITVVCVFLYLNANEKKSNKYISEKYTKANILLTSNNKLGALKIFDEIILSENKFYSILALNNILEKQLTKEENKILNYFEIIENINQTKLSSELIQFKKALYLIKVGKNELAKKILENLINENSILKEAAKEIITK